MASIKYTARVQLTEDDEKIYVPQIIIQANNNRWVYTLDKGFMTEKDAHHFSEGFFKAFKLQANKPVLVGI